MSVFSSDHSRPVKVGNQIKIDLGKRLSTRVLRIYDKNGEKGYDRTKRYLFNVATRLGKKYNLEPEGFWFDEDTKKFTLHMKKAEEVPERPEEEVKVEKPIRIREPIKIEKTEPEIEVEVEEEGKEDIKTRILTKKIEEEKVAKKFKENMEKVGQGVIDTDKLRKTDKTDVPFAGPEPVKEKPKIPTPEGLDKKEKPEIEKKPEKPGKPTKPGIAPEKKKIEERIEDLTPEEGLGLIKSIVEKIEKELPKKESAKLNLASRVYKTPEALLRLAFKALDTLEPKTANKILKIARIRSKFRKDAKFNPITRTDFDVKPSGDVTEAFEDTPDGKKKEEPVTHAHEPEKGDKIPAPKNLEQAIPKGKPEFAYTEKAPDGTKASKERKEKVDNLISLIQEKGLIDQEDVAIELGALKKMSDRQLDYLEQQVNSISENNGTMFVHKGQIIDLKKAITD